MWVNPVIGNKVDFAIEQNLEVFQKAAKIKKGAAGLGSDKQVQITSGCGTISCHRAKVSL